MTSNSHRESAKIFEFPVRARGLPAGTRDAAKPAAVPASARVVKAEFGKGWYHEAAVVEVEPARKR
jgi:hypothetical protein